MSQLSYSLPFSEPLNTGLAILTRSNLEQMVVNKSSQKNSTRKHSSLVEVDDVKEIVDDASSEMARLFVLWDAVRFYMIMSNE